jgi:carboxyl-terminal processing protease
MALRKIILFYILCFSITGCRDLIVTGPDTSQNIADFETTWQIVKSVYPYFQFKHINWDSIHTVYRPMADAAKGDEIFTILFNMLAELKDGHVSLQVQGGSAVPTYHPPRVEKDQYAYNRLVVRKYFNKELCLAGDKQVEYEFISDSVGYIYIASLSNTEPILDGFDSALEYLKGTKGLIIDVRNNGGGSDNNSMGIIERLISSGFDIFPYPLPGGGLEHGSFIYPRGPFQYTKPVVLLINGVCFSSCEDFAEMMKHVATVTAIGDTTAGASGAPQPFALPSGKKINVSTKDFRRYDGLTIEWNGVPPDILVQQTEADINQAKDKQLEYAIQLLQ